MAPHPFVDYVKIFFKSGKGGNGVVAWRREKYVPKGGPDGGDGGEGGSIYIQGNSQLWTLLDLKYRKHIKADRGESGAGARKKGKKGKDIILQVPLGTVVKDLETDEVLAEVKEEGEKVLILEGGHGGKGNWNFKSSTNQAPEYASQGGDAKELTAILELKILADVGLVGFPNAGKSTLLSVVTAAKPKIADYPFTTLVPNLGIIKYKGYRSFVMADIPGIIEGAHHGKGLGITFLRHIERNSILLFLVPADSEDILKEFEILKNELQAYNSTLMDKKMILGISKTDLIQEEIVLPNFEKELPGVEVMLFSSITGEGLEVLKDVLWAHLDPDN